MMRYYFLNFVLLSLVLLLFTCSETKNPQASNKFGENYLPSYLKNVKNLKVYSVDSPSIYTVELVRETVFESDGNFFINGYIGDVAVDGNDVVYISATKPEAVGVYVFKANGDYITTISKVGRGPGEYETISSIQTSDNKLWILDSRLQKMGSFSLEDYSHIKDEVISRDEIRKTDSLTYRLKANKLFATDQEKLLLKMSSLTVYEANDTPFVLFHKLSKDGNIIPGNVLKLDRFKFYFPQKEGAGNLPFPMPFTRGTLIAITNESYFYIAWTEDFLIKKYDPNGNYLHAFYYPIPKARLFLDELSISKSRRKVLDRYEKPHSWPALHTMEIDDEGRLWVFTITESDSTFEGWVLDKEGNLLAKFDWPGKRSSRSVMVKPLIFIKNDYLYARERDISNGIDRIIKYKIVMKER